MNKRQRKKRAKKSDYWQNRCADRIADFLEEVVKRLDYIASAPTATDPSPTPPEPQPES
jgi:hypothetical protein